MIKVITFSTFVVCVLTLQSATIATVYYDTGLSYTIGAVPGDDIYIGNTVNDDLWLDYNTINIPGTHLNLTAGGSVDMDLEAFGYSSITITGGSVGYHIHSHDNSSVAISGGFAGNNIYASDNSIMTMNGGSVGNGFRVYGNGKIYLDGYNFEVTAGGVTTALVPGDSLSIYSPLIEGEMYSGGTITGNLANGDLLDNAFRIYNTGDYEGSADIFIIPEPATLSLILLGGIGLAKSRKR